MLYFPTTLLAFPSILLDWPRYEVGCSCLPALIWKHFGHLAGDVPNPPLESGLWPTLCCRAPRSQLSPLRPYLAVTSLTQHPMGWCLHWDQSAQLQPFPQPRRLAQSTQTVYFPSLLCSHPTSSAPACFIFSLCQEHLRKFHGDENPQWSAVFVWETASGRNGLNTFSPLAVHRAIPQAKKKISWLE